VELPCAPVRVTHDNQRMQGEWGRDRVFSVELV
jgi:hypothetical protein